MEAVFLNTSAAVVIISWDIDGLAVENAKGIPRSHFFGRFNGPFFAMDAFLACLDGLSVEDARTA